MTAAANDDDNEDDKGRKVCEADDGISITYLRVVRRCQSAGCLLYGGASALLTRGQRKRALAVKIAPDESTYFYYAN